jgi:hypothetical protein
VSWTDNMASCWSFHRSFNLSCSVKFFLIIYFSFFSFSFWNSFSWILLIYTAFSASTKCLLSVFLVLTLVFFFFFWGVGLSFELRALYLQSRHLTTWTIPHAEPPAPGNSVGFCSIGTWTESLHSTSHFFVKGFFRDRVSQTVSPGWLRTSILLISASQVARIVGVSPQQLCGSCEGLCLSVWSSLSACSHLEGPSSWAGYIDWWDLTDERLREVWNKTVKRSFLWVLFSFFREKSDSVWPWRVHS